MQIHVSSKFSDWLVRLIPLLAVVPASWVWVRSTGGIERLWDGTAPAGQQFYLLSKWFALVALYLLLAQLVLMTIRRIGVNSQYTLRTHKYTGFALLAAVVGHVSTFFIATSIRAGHLQIKLFVPNFATDFYTSMVGVGVFAFYCLFFVVYFGAQGFTRESRFSRYHKLVILPTTLFILIHGLAIGSETRSITILAVYLLVIILLMFIIICRR